MYKDFLLTGITKIDKDKNQISAYQEHSVLYTLLADLIMIKEIFPYCTILCLLCIFVPTQKNRKKGIDQKV